MAEKDLAIQTVSLTKVFSDWWGRNKVTAVDDLNLQVRKNEIFGLLGPNGSGKSTTIKMALGLLFPTKGYSFVLGGQSTNPKISARVGFLPEESYLYRYLNARETLDFYGRLFSLPRAIRKERTEALLDMVGLKAVANRPVGTFSKGMARRIGLAQALINDPDLLILDEPTTGLDPIGTRQIKDLLILLAKRGKTILLCSHLLADVEDVCDRIAIMYGGKIQTQGQVKELLRVSDKLQITTPSSISRSTQEKIKELIQQETSEYEFTIPMDKLESLFIKTVADAQKRNQHTSGAVSKTEIGGFLAEISSKQDSVLDKLVQTDVSEAPGDSSTESPASESKTEPVEQPDLTILNGLAEQGSDEVEVIETKKDSKPDSIESPEEIDHSVLDQLTDDDEVKQTRQNRSDRENRDDA